MADGLLVSTWEVFEATAGDTCRAVLEHERIPFVSYAFEWPFELLKRATLLHLELIARLIPAGFILADATPSNVMFRGIRPVFIDAGSIVPYTAGDVWQGFQQFLQTMLYPLMLAAHKGVPYHAWLRGAGEDGIPARQAARLFSWSDCLKPGVMRYAKLGAALDGVAGRRFEVTRREIANTGMTSSIILKNVRGLERLVRSLAPPDGQSMWLDYNAGPYDAAAAKRKREMVHAAANGRPAIAWDVGCNIGDYSILLAEHTGLVVAIDHEEAVLNRLCRRCMREHVANVLPLVADIANPSPAQGWRGAERRALLDRGAPDLIVMLGLLHHLILTRNVPADELFEQLAMLAPTCLLEHVSPDDPMAQRIRLNAGAGRNVLPNRRDFEAMVSRYFALHDAVELTPTRSMYLLHRR